MNVTLISGSKLFTNQVRQILHRIRECEVEVRESVHSALQFLIQHKPDLILTEWQLGQHSAIELVKTLNSNDDWKSIPVIICLDQSSEQMVDQTEALGVSHIIVKPLNQNALSRLLAGFYPVCNHKDRKKQLFDNGEIRRKLKSISVLAPLPTLVKKIMEVFRDPNSSARDLAEQIKKDQVLTARILKIVNSAYYGFHREIGNVDHAIVVLGFDEIMNIAQAACLMNAFKFEDNRYFNREKFWVHAIGTAYIAKSLCRYTKDVIQKDAFVVGLLHDFGKVILNQYFGEIFRNVINQSSQQNRKLYHVCRDHAGIDHPEIGALVAESWKLPIDLVYAIRYHHQPNMAPQNRNEVHLSHLANILCHKYNIGASGNPVADEPHPVSLKSLEIEDLKLDDVWKSLEIDPYRMKRILR